MAEITPFDLPNALSAHYQLVQQQNALQGQNVLAQALPQLATNPQNAFATVANSGNVDAMSKYLPIAQQYTAQQRAKQTDKNQAIGTAALTLKNYAAGPIRQAVYQSMAADLAPLGIDVNAPIDLSDAGLDSIKTRALGFDAAIAEADKQRGLSQKDTEIANTAAANANTASYQKGELAQGATKIAQEGAKIGETIRHDKMQEGGGLDANGLPMIDDPVTQSHMHNILSGNETMAQVPAPYKNRVSLALQSAPTSSYSPLASSRYAMAATRITTPLTKLPQFELTANGLPYLQRIDAALKTPGSVSDQDLLDSLTKLNTAGNAVTDAQIKVITDGKSLSDWAGTIANKFKNGGILSDNQRKQIKEIANNIYQNYKKGYQPVYDQATAQLDAAGIPKAFWTIPDLNKLGAQQSDVLAPTAPAAAPAPHQSEDTKVLGGKTYHKINGQWMQE